MTHVLRKHDIREQVTKLKATSHSPILDSLLSCHLFDYVVQSQSTSISYGKGSELSNNIFEL